MKTFQELLREFNACEDAREWAKGKTFEQAVEECPRGDWLLFLAQEVDVDLQPLTLAKGHCANTVRHLMTRQSSIDAVDIAFAFGEGKATREELDAAAAAYARKQNQKQTADICRKYIGQMIIDKVNKLIN